MHILHYIHLNPLDFLPGAEEWRSGNIKSMHEALNHLDEYRWSSYLDYCGIRNIPSLITTDLFQEVLGDVRTATTVFLRDREIHTLQDIRIE